MPRATIDRVAGIYADSKRAIFAWAMGLTHHVSGVRTVQILGSLAACRGMLGRSGCGLLPLRGHSNVQGDRTMGIWEKPQIQRRGMAMGFFSPHGAI